MAVSPARKAASEILLAVEHGRAHSDDLLREKAVAELSVQDRHLTTALVLGVLRWQILLDQRIREYLDRPQAKLDAEIQIALRLGAYQFLFMQRIPAHAAIDESVELAKRAGHRFASRMVNAVLRKLAAASREAAPNPEGAYPGWMTERWVRSYGADATQALCVYGQSEPAATIRLADAQVEGELRQGGIALEPGRLLRAASVVTAGDVTSTAAFRAGRARFQDEGSQVIAEIAGHGQTILDCCAAPGGKTLILAERNPNSKIVACEVSPQRLARLRDRFASRGVRVECRLGDAAEIDDPGAYDVVLADVPCSGTGTLGRNPEIRHRLKQEDLARQSERQVALFRAALRAVRPGGRVAYSTCSLEPEENEEVVMKVLKEHSAMRVVPIPDRIAEMNDEGILVAEGSLRIATCVTPEGFLRLPPGVHGTDGFFVALLGRA
jgi:16S rRNA (cytosine967-C5)-methyltransferase